MLRKFDGSMLPEAAILMNMDVDLYQEKSVNSLKDAIALMGEKIGFETREHYAILCMDAAYRPICVGLLQYGDETGCRAPLKQICQIALLGNATNVIVFHNHPGYGEIGRVIPEADIRCTSTVLKALNLLDITLVDNIIFHPEKDKNGERVLYTYSIRNKKPWLFKPKALKEMVSKEFRTIDEIDLTKNHNKYTAESLGITVRELYSKTDKPAYMAFSPEELDEALEDISKEN